MKEEFIADFIPGVRAHISIGNSTHTWVGSNFHLHNEFELIQILDGKLKVKTDHSDFSGQTGDIIFIDSRVPHQTGTFPDCPTNHRLIQKYVFSHFPLWQEPLIAQFLHPHPQEVLPCFLFLTIYDIIAAITAVSTIHIIIVEILLSNHVII